MIIIFVTMLIQLIDDRSLSLGTEVRLMRLVFIELCIETFLLGVIFSAMTRNYQFPQ